MKISKKIELINVCLEIVKIKDYSKFGLYQVYKIVDGKRISLYKECYTTQEFKRKYINRK